MPNPGLSDEQLEEAASAYRAANGNKSEAASALKLDRSTFNNRLNKAIMRGFDTGHDLDYKQPPGMKVTGVSSLVDPKTGKATLQWVKTSVDKEQQEAIARAALEAMCVEIPRLSPVSGPTDTSPQLCNQYTFTDYHLGMLAWHKEGGADWDLKIAERVLLESFRQMMAGAPVAGTCIIGQIGDFLHSDGILPVTPTSGHILDQDGRFSKIVEAAIRVLRSLIDMALEKHEHVHVVMAEGNHDITSSIWLRKMFKAMYENEPRITVNDSELPYYVYQHGKCMIGFHHGHKKRLQELPLLFAAQYPEIWGATEHRVINTGHMHHRHVKEHSGVTVYQHSTLAARDAHASRGGYLSERKATCMTYHSEFGLVGTNEVSPEMVGA